MYSSLMSQSHAQRWIVALMYSGPLSQRIDLRLTPPSNDLPQRADHHLDGKEQSISMPKASRLKSSMTLRVLVHHSEKTRFP
jgi:hypothetical protein